MLFLSDSLNKIDIYKYICIIHILKLILFNIQFMNNFLRKEIAVTSLAAEMWLGAIGVTKMTKVVVVGDTMAPTQVRVEDVLGWRFASAFCKNNELTLYVPGTTRHYQFLTVNYKLSKIWQREYRVWIVLPLGYHLNR